MSLETILLSKAKYKQYLFHEGISPKSQIDLNFSFSQTLYDTYFLSYTMATFFITLLSTLDVAFLENEDYDILTAICIFIREIHVCIEGLAYSRNVTCKGGEINVYWDSIRYSTCYLYYLLIFTTRLGASLCYLKFANEKLKWKKLIIFFSVRDRLNFGLFKSKSMSFPLYNISSSII